MSIIEEIKRDVGHDGDCWIGMLSPDGQRTLECNCSRRRKIAWLERLEEPTEAMLAAGSIVICGKDQDMYRADARVVLEAMLQSSEEML